MQGDENDFIYQQALSIVARPKADTILAFALPMYAPRKQL